MRSDLFHGYSCPSCYNADDRKFERVEEIDKGYGIDWRCRCMACGMEFTIEWMRTGYDKISHHHKICETYAAKMRERPTPAEAKLWEHLKKKQLGARFIRQHIMWGWIADFGCPSRSLVVEIDGSSHIGREKKDAKRDWFLKKYRGFKVLRFTNEQVMNNVEKVIEKIKANLK